MSNKILYQLKGTMFRSKKNETNPIEINEIFEDDNPIIAREKVFNAYQNYIDVFLQGKEKEYISYEQTVIELQDFTNSYKREFVKIGNEIIAEIDVDFDKGLSIYMVHKNSPTFVTLEGEKIYENKLLIHFIENKLSDLVWNILDNLFEEFKVYELNKYNFKNYKIEIETADPFSNESNVKDYLETPIDFYRILII
jgi:hypothetical protein